MDERGCISRKRYEHVEKITKEAMMYTTRKEAEPVINQLEQLRYDIPTRCSFKIGELMSSLLTYCNQRTDKSSYRGNVMNQLYGLKSMVSDEIKDEEWLPV